MRTRALHHARIHPNAKTFADQRKFRVLVQRLRGPQITLRDGGAASRNREEVLSGGDVAQDQVGDLIARIPNCVDGVGIVMPKEA